MGGAGPVALAMVDLAVVVCEPAAARALTVAPLLKQLADQGVPHMLFINKIDTLEGSVGDTLTALQGFAKSPLVLRQVPIMHGEAVGGYVDVVSERAYRYRKGQASELIQIPSELHDDERDALMTIRSEAGGVDAADFAEMLMRMYLRWAERHGYPTEVYETSYAEEAGLKSATFAVKVPYAFGTLSVESGTHRLVRISPFDNQGRRQTSFAGVEVMPVVAEIDHIDIPENELRVDVYRSSGPGGQSVNTTDSAVRLTHIPTGIVVTCQNEKSQLQNKASAMRVLQARLLERKRQEEEAKLAGLKQDTTGSWGDQMRSYVLHPYQMVKDLRTEYETGNPTSVFDGELDEFIEAGIRWRKQTQLAG